MKTKSRKRRRRRLRPRIEGLIIAIAELWKQYHRRSDACDGEGADRVRRRIGIRQCRCAEAMSRFSENNTPFDADAAEASLRRADELIAKYGG